MEVLYEGLTFFCDGTGLQVAFFRHDLRSISEEFEPIDGYAEKTYLFFQV